jgi:hypothetical protein
MKITTRVIVVLLASMASLAQAQQSSSRPTDVGTTTAQPEKGSGRQNADPVDTYITASMERQHSR